MPNNPNPAPIKTHNPKNRKVIVGMSGGVDSSVSALLLLQQGYDVEGLFMKNWDEDDGTEYCTAQQDLSDAEKVCKTLGIPLHSANFAAEYWDNVFEYFLDEYRVGRTPNPDILCNREIKFKVFLEYAELLGADFIATGHYVRKHTENGHTLLRKGLDNNKDQSYFLHAVEAAALNKTLFPVGELEKTEVRRLAAEHGLITYNKKDSTGICFIGERRFKDFLEQYIPAQPGPIKTPDGTQLGEHQGLMFYTLGQREGLGIGGVKTADEAPWYVVAKDVPNNTLIVAQGNNHPLLFSMELNVSQLHWINPRPAGSEFSCMAKIRYRQSDQACRIKLSDNGTACTVTFDEPQRAATPGQSLVMYQDDICLGGGVIESSRNPA
jgi:tRNA-specific 2-thiouridylase